MSLNEYFVCNCVCFKLISVFFFTFLFASGKMQWILYLSLMSWTQHTMWTEQVTLGNMKLSMEYPGLYTNVYILPYSPMGIYMYLHAINLSFSETPLAGQVWLVEGF